MEVPGKKLQSIASAFDENFCQPCCQDGESVKAEAYCTSCKKWLCFSCVIAHRKQMQSHRICDQSSMPASISDKSNDEESYEPCDKHPHEFIKYFCIKHDSPLCGHCLAFNHRSCNVNLISELCKSEYGSVNNDIVDLLTDVDKCASVIENNMDLVTQLSKDEVLKLKEYRDDIDKYFEQRMGFLLENIQQMKHNDETLLDSLKPKCDQVKSKVETLKSRLSFLENKPAKLFIATKRAQTELAGLRSTLADMNKEKIIHEYQFEKDSITEKLLASNTGLGTMKEKYVAPTEKQLLANCITKELAILVAIVIIGIIIPVVVIEKGDYTPVNLTSLRYTRDLDIPVNIFTSEMLLLSGDRLLMAEWRSSKMKMIDLHTNKLMFEVSLQSQPQSMCILPAERLAVCLPNKGRIQFLKTLGQLTLEENIEVDVRCLAIGYHNDRLIVSYTGGKVEVMDMAGNVIKTIDKDDSGESIFGDPSYLETVSENETTVIYISDGEKSTITKLNMDLNIIWTFQDPALRKPNGITAVGNQLLICGWGENNIMCLDLPSGKMTQLLGEVEGIRRPTTVCYNHKQNNMYVIGLKDCSVKVYKAE